MDLYPAIDLRAGRCVRLVEGDFGRETVYGDDPVAVARGFQQAGATWLHVVDLDAARTGEPVNRDTVAAIAAAVTVPVQCGGGVRSVAAAGALFDAGVSRVVIGHRPRSNDRGGAHHHPFHPGVEQLGRRLRADTAAGCTGTYGGGDGRHHGRLTGSPVRAASRSTTCSQGAPACSKARASSRGRPVDRLPTEVAFAKRTHARPGNRWPDTGP